MTHTPEPAFRNLDHISSNAQDTSKLAALSARIAELEAAVHHAEYKMEGWLCKQYPLETCLYPDSKDWVDGSYRDRVEWLHTMYESAKIEIAQMEAMLDSVGAGGVGQSIKPPVQADTAQKPGAGIPASVPTGWKLVPMEPTAAMLDAAFDIEVVHTEWGVDAFVENTDEVYRAMLAAAPEAPAQQKPVAHLPCCGYTDTSALQWNPYNGAAQCHNCGQVYTAPQPAENLHCKSTQKRLATLWGYEKARQPLTDEQILSIVRVAPALDTVEAEFLHIARAIEAAHGITGGQQ